MVFDTYVIDEYVARNDMAKMSQAIEQLNEARRAVSQLLNEAQSIQGQTGKAIAEKAQELQDRIDRLTRQLQTSIALLNSTVAHYQQLDAEYAAKIKG